MRLRNVGFETWLRSHGKKAPEERWLRELYPWPVLAQVNCDQKNIGCVQQITYDEVHYEVTLERVDWQPSHGTFKYRLRVESEGLAWHARSFSDLYNMCGTPEGMFVTLFHAKKKEPLEKVARAFFGRRWTKLREHSFKSLAVSRFLAAGIVAQVVERVFADPSLTHYPGTRLVGGMTPMFAKGTELWIGYRFFAEDAYEWARRSEGGASRIVVLYFADTKYQFNTELPPCAEVRSIGKLDAVELGGCYGDFIRVLLRGLDLPDDVPHISALASIVTGQLVAPPGSILEADVHEALAALKLPCTSKSELRYQLAAAVVLNAWIEEERRLGFTRRKKFYAFKMKVGRLVDWAVHARLNGVVVWAEAQSNGPILYVRIDDVDFSFHAIPNASSFLLTDGNAPKWSGVRLKPIAPKVLAWARMLRSR